MGGIHWVAGLGLLALAGCADEGVTTPKQEGTSIPFVYSSVPAMPGPIVMVMGSSFPVTVTLRDADLGDTLYVRVFRDYTRNPGPPLIEKSFGNDDGWQDRVGLLETTSWCTGATLNEELLFTVVVADRPFEAGGTAEPIYQAVTDRGLSSRQSWLGRCVQAL